MKRLLKRIAGITMMCAVLSLSVQSVKATEIAGADSAIISVESYEVEEGALVAGEQVTINFTVKNNSAGMGVGLLFPVILLIVLFIFARQKNNK